MKIRIAVVLVNYNGWADTYECLHSLYGQLDADTFVVVVDNASTNQAGRELIEPHEHVIFFDNACNQGWAGGNNRGIEIALEHGAEWIFLLNNDTVVSEEIFSRLRQAIASSSFRILGVVINEYSDRAVVQTEGVRFNAPGSDYFFESISLPIKRTDPPTISQVDIVNGCAVMISRHVLDAIGLIDERFFLICEESDFCLRAQRAHFTLGVLHETHVWHKHSVTFNRAGKPLQRYYGTRNLWLLLRNHRGGPGRRSHLRSVLYYLRHCYYVYTHELELGNQSGAEAIAIGMSDAWLGNYGPRPIEPNWLSRALYSIAAWMRWAKAKISSTKTRARG